MPAPVRIRRLARLLASAQTLLVLLCLGVCASASAKIIYVNKNATGATHSGASWATAFLTVNDGLNASVSADEVWVAASAPAASAYLESITPPAGVTLYGGFSGVETARSQRNWRTNVTVLDGSGNAEADVVTFAGLGGILDGFVVQSGDTGISANAGAAPAVSNCIISGGDYGIFMYPGATLTASNCTISGNGDGVYVYGGTANVTNCTMSGNSNGVYVNSGGSAVITNCIAAFNETGISRYAASTTVTLSHNDVYGNTSANYANFTNQTGTNGNISQDPKLSNPYHSIHIQPGSPCIGAGDDTAVRAGWTDIDGQPRIIGTHVDIGSDESDATTWTVPSRTWYVSPTGNDAADGLSWAKAKKTLSGALTVAQGTDEVWVARGTYTENVTIPAGVSVYGGFTGTETSKSQRDWKANNTVLDGAANPTFNVVTAQFLNVGLNGFTVRNGDIGVYVYYGTATITNCTISGNSHDGVSVGGGKATVSNCAVSGNSFSGVYVDGGGAATLTNCAISGNPYCGVYVYYGGASNVSNCTITGNSNGVYVNGTASVANCIVAFNQTGISAFGAMTLSHNDGFGNTSANYTNIPNPTGTNGNISQDPLFGDGTGGDYRLLSGSPCIDAGDDSAVAVGATDMDGQPRILGPHVDMGAYEFKPIPFTVADAASALRIAGGLTRWSTADQARLNAEISSPRVDLRDAVRIARKAAGLDANP